MVGPGLVLSILVSSASAAGAAGEAARTLPLPLPLAGRDGIVARSADGRQVSLYLPREDGTFERHVLPSLPSPIAAMDLLEASGDGDLDLALRLEDGSVALWEGNGRGDFAPREAPGAEGHHGHGMLLPALDPAEEDAIRTRLQGARRGAAWGRFLPGGGEAVAVAGPGTGSKVLLQPKDGSAAVEAVLTPRTSFTVFVGQGGTVFNPSSVILQPGDTVHWVWSASGHNVVSGSSCTANNLFCSPTNINCAANPTSALGATYDRVFPSAGSFPYFCRPHCAFGMTGTVTVSTATANVLEAVNLQIAKSGANTQFTFAPACGATGHAIYIGEGSLESGLVWSDSLCADASGSHVASLGTPAGLQYFVVVGQSASAEGSYGLDSRGSERREADGIGACDLPQTVFSTCP